MKMIILGAAAISSFALAAPAAAQYSNNGYQNEARTSDNFAMRFGELQSRIEAGVQSGAISRQEARPLRQQLRQLSQLERRYNLDGLSGPERSDLQQRMRNLRQQVRYADGGAQGRYDQYDREDRYGQSGRYDNRIDSNWDGYDDRDLDRDGRWDDDANNAGYQQPSGGLGGVIDALINGGGGLRVGQQASANLYGVPGEYRSQYRDGNGAYYRSDGRQIYQIDARSQTVTRVYPMGR